MRQYFNKKVWVLSLLDKIGLIWLYCFIRKRFDKKITILAYHRVVDVSDDYHRDIELVSASVQEFEWQIRYISEHYNPITFEQLNEILIGNAVLPERPLIVTFDDGFADNYYNAFPILKKYNVPATIFLATDYINNCEEFWFDELISILNSIKEDNVIFNERKVFLKKDLNISQHIMEELKLMSNDKRRVVIADFKKRYARFSPKADKQSLPLTWSQIQEMSRHGIEFGSHTMSHPILSTVNDEQLVDELAGSKLVIESMLRKNCMVLAYPVGRKIAFNDKVIEESKKHYKFGVSYLSGVNNMTNLDLFVLKRLHIERYIDKKHFRLLLEVPEIIHE